jgi:hypothetical protein
MSFQPPRPEPVGIPGPAGPLQAIVDTPAGAAGERFAVLCHPHPRHGGTMTNKVVHTVARAFNELGVPTVRFNFRGVGNSAGVYDHGEGETQDALAAVEYGRQRWPGAALWLAGFSFGGVVAVRAAQMAAPGLLVTVAPAVTRLEVAGLQAPSCPWLIVQGDADDVVEPRSVLDWARRQSPPPTVSLLPGAGHFFHGMLPELREVIVNFVAQVAPRESPPPR